MPSATHYLTRDSLAFVTAFIRIHGSRHFSLALSLFPSFSSYDVDETLKI